MRRDGEERGRGWGRGERGLEDGVRRRGWGKLGGRLGVRG